jgi:hypothetical protein
MNQLIEIPVDDQDQAAWLDEYDRREDERYQQEKDEQAIEQMAWYEERDRQEREREHDGFFELLANSVELYSRHEINGGVYLVLRDTSYSNGLIPPVVVWGFGVGNSLLSCGHLRSHAHAIEELEELRAKLAA